jgi:hypothetical protein
MVFYFLIDFFGLVFWCFFGWLGDGFRAKFFVTNDGNRLEIWAEINALSRPTVL